MRFAILADIHGNVPALEAVLDDLERHAVDGIMVAGDIIGGAQPLKTLQLLRPLKVWMIRGNGEKYYLDYAAGTAPESWQWSEQWASMRWLYRRLTAPTLEFLASSSRTTRSELSRSSISSPRSRLSATPDDLVASRA